ncbi:MAG: PhzF family phenazine biosynthesis protein [Pseudomarimonas sp.]
MSKPASSSVAFKQVDVFTHRAFKGNPVAVILDANGLDAHRMQQIATWTNLSETTFVLPPTVATANYRLRIFTPRQELPFAGHPSVGTAHALVEAGLVNADATEWVQECAAGLLPLRMGVGGDNQQLIFVRSPDARWLPLIDSDHRYLTAALGAAPLQNPAPQMLDNGPQWWLAEFADAATVRELTPDFHQLAALTLARGAVGVAAFARCAHPDHQLVVRCFCPADGINEDPVTGSANACIAAWLAGQGRLPAANYQVSQGREMGRDGKLHLQVADDGVWVGGSSVTVIDGRIALL